MSWTMETMVLYLWGKYIWLNKQFQVITYDKYIEVLNG
jgi:hypothetical protein